MTLARRLVAEFTGTGLLVAVVVGSGIAVTRLTTDGALRLLVCSLVTAMGLAVLIVVFAPAGGAQFNPVVTASDWVQTRGTPRGYGAGQALAVIGCQVAGAIGGAALADTMFAQPVLAASRTHRGGAGVLLGEAVATAGLLLVIVTLARTGRSQHAAWAVGAWIGAAYWFTSSTSFANPAVTIGRALTEHLCRDRAIVGAGVRGGASRRRRAGHGPGHGALPGAARQVRGCRAGPAGRLSGKGTPMGAIPDVLFVCTHNAGRSQMAAALLDREAAGRVRVTSAGSQPASELNPAVVAAMAEIGLDISREFPKPLTTDKVQAADIVITMGCGDACPVFPGKRYLDWDLPDPAGLDLGAVRAIRDDISQRVRDLVGDLGIPA